MLAASNLGQPGLRATGVAAGQGASSIPDPSPALRCCAIGFSEADLRILETLVSMFRSKLHTNWVIDAAWDAAGCRLMLCDLDNGPGSEAWHREGPEGVEDCGPLRPDVPAAAQLAALLAATALPTGAGRAEAHVGAH